MKKWRVKFGAYSTSGVVKAERKSFARFCVEKLHKRRLLLYDSAIFSRQVRGDNNESR
jgi:hypothetical protein